MKSLAPQAFYFSACSSQMAILEAKNEVNIGIFTKITKATIDKKEREGVGWR